MILFRFIYSKKSKKILDVSTVIKGKLPRWDTQQQSENQQ